MLIEDMKKDEVLLHKNDFLKNQKKIKKKKNWKITW